MDAPAAAWRRAAEDSIRAAMRTATDHPRSAASRAYYAGYAAAHAALLGLGDTPRQTLGAWSHDALPDALRAAISRRTRAATQAKTYKQTLLNLRTLREIADYNPLPSFEPAASRAAVRDARRLVTLAAEVCR